MELKHYLRLFGKWFWLLILVGVAAGASSYLLYPVRYQAKALIAVGDYIRSPTPEHTDVLTGIQLAETYAVIATTPDVIQPAAEAAGIRISNLEKLDKLIQARILPNTSILVIEVKYENPERAAQLANEIANRIIAQSRYLELIEGAQIPTKPLHPTRGEVAVIGSILGLLLVSGAVSFQDYLNESIKNAEEAVEILALPVVGTIPKYRGVGKKREQEIKRTTGDERFFEQHRALRTNILRSSAQVNKQVFLITSAFPKEGKSIITTNLAIAIARTNQNVLLIDADMHCPSLHTLFGLDNDKGLINLLESDSPKPDHRLKLLNIDGPVTEVVRHTEIPNLRLITSGGTSIEPGALFGPRKMEAWMEVLLAARDVDVVLIDTPPAFAASDALDVASQLNASVLLVVRARKTSREAILALKERCQYLGIDLLGVILNQVQRNITTHYTYNYKEQSDSKIRSMQKIAEVVLHTDITKPKEPKKVLVVEDDDGLRTLLEAVLSNEDYEVNTASEGEAGITTALEWKPDLILLDIMLPDINGYEICRRLKSTKATAKIPVIFVSAKATLDDKLEGFASGGIDYIVKPFESEELVFRVDAHLRNNSMSHLGNGRNIPALLR